MIGRFFIKTIFKFQFGIGKKITNKDRIGVIIASQSIFNTLKSIFEVMWDSGSE